MFGGPKLVNKFISEVFLTISFVLDFLIFEFFNSLSNRLVSIS